MITPNQSKEQIIITLIGKYGDAVHERSAYTDAYRDDLLAAVRAVIAENEQLQAEVARADYATRRAGERVDAAEAAVRLAAGTKPSPADML